MTKCVNIKNRNVIRLSEITGFPPAMVGSKIATWQAIEGNENKIPTHVDLGMPFLPWSKNVDIYQKYNLLNVEGTIKELAESDAKKWAATNNGSPEYYFEARMNASKKWVISIAKRLWDRRDNGQLSLFNKTKGDMLPNQVVINILDKLKNRFKVDYEIISPAQAEGLLSNTKERYNNETGFYFKGKVYIVDNGDGLDLDSAIHEYGHPFMRALNKYNPSLFQNIVADILSTKEGEQLLEEVRGLKYSKSEEVEEVAVRALTKLAKKDYDIETGTLFEKALDKLLRFLTTMLKDVFGKKELKLSTLSAETSLQTLADIFNLKQGVVDLNETINVKPGVSELFESNPELANAVYEALGFNKQINEIADTKKVDEFIKKYKDALPNIKDGKTLISHLQTVSNRNTGTTKQFADLIIKLSKSNKGLEKLLNNPNLYAKPNSVGDEGAFHWSLFNNLSVNKIVLELDHFKTNTYDDVFLHELIHNLTTQFIVKDSDLFNQNFYNKVKELYSVFDNHLEANKKVNEPLLKSTKDDVKNLKRLKEYFEFLPSDAIQQELLFGKIGSLSTVKDVKLDYKSLENKSKQDVIKELERLLSFKESRIQEIEKGDKDYYYFNSKTFKQENVLSEFLATFINDANFREQLKNIDYKNNKSIFQAIIDLISEFIGLTKNDSLYNEFVLNLTNFINNNDYSTIAEQTQKTAYQNRINLLEQQKQQAQQLYSNFLSNFVDNNFDTIIQDLQTKNILDKKCS